MPISLFFLFNNRANAQKVDSLNFANQKKGDPTHTFFSNKRSFNINTASITNKNDQEQYEEMVRETLQGQPLFPDPKTTVTNKSNRTSGNISITISSTGTTCGYRNGSFTVYASGGTPPYMYSFNGQPFQSSAVYSLLPAGTYNAVVKDSNGQTDTSIITLSNTYAPPALGIVGSAYPTVCSGQNGIITLQAGGGLPPYTYSDDGINFQSSNIFTNLSAFSLFFSFFVRDSNGCVHSYTLLGWGVNCPITFLLGTSFSACHNDGWFIIGSVSGGTPPYQYSLDGINYQASGNFNNLGAGIYKIYIKDSTGALKINSAQLFEGCYVTADAIATNASCGANDGSINISVTYGTPPYQYSIDGINFQTSNIFSGLASGNYTVFVNDSNSIQGMLRIRINNNCPVITLIKSDDTCNKNNGTITATGANGTAPYQYSIDGVNFQTSNIFSGLGTGSDTITLKDANGFTSNAAIVINNVCVSVSAITSNSTCSQSNGSITVTGSNGTVPYRYSIDGINFQTSNIFNGLAQGTYNITVKDFTGITGADSITINNTPGPQINTAVTAASCSNNNGSINVSGTGGTLPFQFSLNTGPYQANNIFANLSPSTDSVFIKDANGCVDSSSVIVISDCPIPTLTATNETCGSSNGSISISVTGGNAPYQYSIDGLNFQPSNIFTGLLSGTYTITVKDSLNATDTASIIIFNICPTVNATATDGICGTANASITAIGSNGNPPYQYSIDGINFQSSNIFTGLTTGTYTITIKDANGLTNTTTDSVNNFPGPSINVTTSPATCVNNNGVISITGAGGTSPLQYSTDGINFQSVGQFNQATSGNYTATVKDANGCQASQSAIVGLIDDLIVNAGNNSIPAFCEGGQITIPSTSNGTSFSWSPTISLNDTHILNPAASPSVTTTYTITATLGICTKSDSITVIVLPAPIADAGAGGTICYGQNMQLNGYGGTGYSWSPPTYLNNSQIQNPLVNHPLNTTTYNLHVTDNNGCTSLNNAAVTVIVTPPAIVFAGNDTSVVLGQPFQLKATDINNSGFTQYSWTPSTGLNNSFIQNPVTDALQEITYTVTATTAAGCEGSASIHVKVYQGPEIYVPSGFTPNNDGKNDILKAIPVGIKQFKYFMIFNRWGVRVFYTNDPGNGWNGKWQGVDQNIGVFVWIAEGIDDNGEIIQRKGTVTLIR